MKLTTTTGKKFIIWQGMLRSSLGLVRLTLYPNSHRHGDKDNILPHLETNDYQVRFNTKRAHKLMQPANLNQQ